MQKLPRIVEVINKAEKHGYQNMVQTTINACMNNHTSIDDTNEEQLLNFQFDLIMAFKNYEWIK